MALATGDPTQYNLNPNLAKPETRETPLFSRAGLEILHLNCTFHTKVEQEQIRLCESTKRIDIGRTAIRQLSNDLRSDEKGTPELRAQK